MTIKVYGLHGESVSDVISTDDNYVVSFRCADPTIIQASEIKTVRVNLLMSIDEGYILNIYPSTFLTNQGVTLFPSPLIIDSSHTGEVSLKLHNCGKNQVNLNRGQPLAQGYLTKVFKVKLKEHEFAEKTLVKTPSRSQRKDTEIQFEVK